MRGSEFASRRVRTSKTRMVQRGLILTVVVELAHKLFPANDTIGIVAAVVVVALVGMVSSTAWKGRWSFRRRHHRRQPRFTHTLFRLGDGTGIVGLSNKTLGSGRSQSRSRTRAQLRYVRWLHRLISSIRTAACHTPTGFPRSTRLAPPVVATLVLRAEIPMVLEIDDGRDWVQARLRRPASAVSEQRVEVLNPSDVFEIVAPRDVSFSRWLATNSVNGMTGRPNGKVPILPSATTVHGTRTRSPREARGSCATLCSTRWVKGAPLVS